MILYSIPLKFLYLAFAPNPGKSRKSEPIACTGWLQPILARATFAWVWFMSVAYLRESTAMSKLRSETMLSWRGMGDPEDVLDRAEPVERVRTFTHHRKFIRTQLNLTPCSSVDGSYRVHNWEVTQKNGKVHQKCRQINRCETCLYCNIDMKKVRPHADRSVCPHQTWRPLCDASRRDAVIQLARCVSREVTSRRLQCGICHPHSKGPLVEQIRSGDSMVATARHADCPSDDRCCNRSTHLMG